jgi:uncharacterized membrane protein YeaQ/YmgE (transglycosylase-associated protein family)
MQAIMDLGGPIGWGGTLLIGLVAGWIAEQLTRSDMGIIRNIITGIIGSFIGGFIANAANIRMDEFISGWFWGNVFVSVIGAVLFLTVMKILRGRRAA